MRFELSRLETELVNAYTRELAVEASALVKQRRDALDRRLRDAFDRTMQLVSNLVARSAPDRARLIVRVALISGWPDARKRSDEEVRRSAVLQQWEREAEDLRARIAAHDQEVDQELNTLLAADAAMTSAERSQIAREVRDILDRVEGEAKRLAAERIADTNRAALPDLVGRIEERPAVHPGKRIDIPAASARMGSATVPDLAALPEDVSAYLDIYIRVHGYKLARTPLGAEDKTSEFIAWLKDHSVGPYRK
jgi:hypothetical protein